VGERLDELGVLQEEEALDGGAAQVEGRGGVGDGAAWVVSMRTVREYTESRWIREATQYDGGTCTSEGWLLPSAKV
jgi:hypothetical protein